MDHQTLSSLDAGFLTLDALLRDPNVTSPEIERAAQDYRDRGILTPAVVAGLKFRGAYSARVTGVVARAVGQKRREGGGIAHRGRIWFPVVVQAEIQDSRRELVVPRFLECDLSASSRELPIAAGATKPWESRLRDLAGLVQAWACRRVRRADPRWASGSISFALTRSDRLEDDPGVIAAVSCDSSFSLAACLALVSAAFDVLIPTTSVAVGLVDPVTGDLLPYSETEDGRDLLRRKIVGIRHCLPGLDTVFVASDDVPVAQQECGPGFEFVGVRNVSDLGLRLNVDPTRFRGRSRSDGSVMAAIFQQVVTVGVGSPFSFRSKQSSLSRAYATIGGLEGLFFAYAVTWASAIVVSLLRSAVPAIGSAVSAAVGSVLGFAVVGVFSVVVGALVAKLSRSGLSAREHVARLLGAYESYYAHTPEPDARVKRRAWRMLGVATGIIATPWLVASLLEWLVALHPVLAAVLAVIWLLLVGVPAWFFGTFLREMAGEKTLFVSALDQATAGYEDSSLRDEIRDGRRASGRDYLAQREQRLGIRLSSAFLDGMIVLLTMPLALVFVATGTLATIHWCLIALVLVLSYGIARGAFDEGDAVARANVLWVFAVLARLPLLLSVGTAFLTVATGDAVTGGVFLAVGGAAGVLAVVKAMQCVGRLRALWDKYHPEFPREIRESRLFVGGPERPRDHEAS